MNEEELEDLLGIGCCEYHIEIGKKAKKEIERLREENKQLQDRINKVSEIIDEVLFIGVKDYRSQIEIIQEELVGSDKE